MRPSMRDHRHLRFGELRGDRLLEILDHRLVGAAPALDTCAQGLVRLRLEMFERQLLELVLDLAHAEAIGNRRVDVSGFLRDLDAPLLRQVMQSPHVVQAVGELDENHADVVDHREQHLAEVLRLPLLARRKLDRAEFGDPFHHVRDVRPEQLTDALNGGLRVLHDVVEEPGGNRHHIQLHVGQQVGDLDRVYQVGLAGVTDLSLVLEGGEHVCPPEHLDVSLGVVAPDFLDEVLEPNHESWCLNF